MGRQERLGGGDVEGLESRAIPEVTKAAVEYRKVRDARMKLTKKEVDAKKKLLEVLDKHEIKDAYRDEDEDILVKRKKPSKPDVQVKKLSDAREVGTDGDDDEDDEG